MFFSSGNKVGNTLSTPFNLSKRYASLKRHIGGNVYVSADSPGLTIDIRHHWLPPVDLSMHPTPQGVTLDFEEYDKLRIIWEAHFHVYLFWVG
jgi:hypothetical protein